MNKVILFALFAITISALRFPIIQPRIPVSVHTNHSVEVEDFKLPPISITIGKELELEDLRFPTFNRSHNHTQNRTNGTHNHSHHRNHSKKNESEVEDFKLPPITISIGKELELEDFRFPTFNRSHNHTYNRTNRTHNHSHNRNHSKKNESEVEDFKLPPITITIGKELELEDLRFPTFNRSHNHTHNRTNRTHNQSHQRNHSKKNESEVEDFKLPPVTITIGKELEVEDLRFPTFNRSHNHTHNRTNRTHNHSHHRNHSKKNESEVEDFKLPPITISIGKELELEDLRFPTFNRSHNHTHNRINRTHFHCPYRNHSKKNQTEVEDFKLPPITITIGKELELEDLRFPTFNRSNNRTQNRSHQRNNTKKNESEVYDFKLPPVTITIGKELEVEDLTIPKPHLPIIPPVIPNTNTDVDSNMEFLSF